ncbi:hypothetical protein BC829DRAFT_386007 [Chytridium lagenaria]|nr:hypothetical protein BC829DRAFT_386007 [Chytridium lagenaria]
MVLGFIAKIAVIYIAIKWFTKDKKQRVEIHGRDGRLRGCDRDARGVVVKWDGKDFSKFVKEHILKAADWIKEQDATATRAKGSTSSTTETLFTAPSNDLPAYTITEYSISETSSAIVISVDVPGFKRDEVQLTVLDVERDILIRGASTGPKPRKLDVKVAMPRTCDLSKMSASISLGVLTIEVAKTDFEGRRVAIEMAQTNGKASPAEDGWEKGF